MRQLFAVMYDDGNKILGLFGSGGDPFEIHQTGVDVELYGKLKPALEAYLERLEDIGEGNYEEEF